MYDFFNKQKKFCFCFNIVIDKGASMDYTSFINNKTLKKNTGDLLKSVDKDGNNSYDKNELKSGIKDAVTIFAKPMSGKAANAAMKKLDTDNDGNITTDEINKFLQSDYDMTLDQAKQMNVKDLVNKIQDIEEAKKKKK